MEGVDMGEDFLNHRGTEAQRFLLGGSEINRKDAKAQSLVDFEVRVRASDLAFEL